MVVMMMVMQRPGWTSYCHSSISEFGLSEGWCPICSRRHTTSPSVTQAEWVEKSSLHHQPAAEIPIMRRRLDNNLLKHLSTCWNIPSCPTQKLSKLQTFSPHIRKVPKDGDFKGSRMTTDPDLFNSMGLGVGFAVGFADDDKGSHRDVVDSQRRILRDSFSSEDVFLSDTVGHRRILKDSFRDLSCTTYILVVF